MTSDIGRPTKILAVVGPNDTCAALQSADALARAHGATLCIVACVEPPHDLAALSRLSGEDTGALLAKAVEQTRERAHAQITAALPECGLAPDILVGKPFFEIIQYVAANGCDYVVKTAEPLSGVNRFLFASTDQHLLRKCPCPVWLQTANAPIRPKRILAAVDLDVWDADEPETLAGLNRRVIDAARGLAQADGAEIIVLHAWEAIGQGLIWAFSDTGDTRVSSERYVNAVLAERQTAMTRLLSDSKVSGAEGPRLVPRLVPRLARGAPEQVIHETAKSEAADVVVMGTVARTGLSGVFIGNTAENIINSLECPVLAVKPDGFQSPLLHA